MENLTTREEEVMQILWDLNRALVREIMDKLPKSNQYAVEHPNCSETSSFDSYKRHNGMDSLFCKEEDEGGGGVRMKNSSLIVSQDGDLLFPLVSSFL